MDDAGIRRSLSNIKDSFREVRSAAKVNLNNIKFNTKDIDTYKKHVGDLTETFEQQERNVSDLKERYDELVAQGKENTQEAQRLRTEYNKQADELNRLGNQVDAAKGKLQELYTEESRATKLGESFKGFGDAISNVSEKLTNVGENMTKWVTLPVAGAVTASIKSFADLEQSVGGIETMFKDSADTVIKNSESAYYRAGVSGVDYMENVTSFSASLLQGLGGDTEEAAQLADTAMVDMADNANKFGTDIGSIQQAYQGFAKDNFTMLDNLKLGYGGTQTEMARLINDSGVLGDTMEVTAENLNEVSFATMIEAIHEIQNEMDVTGTTAQEAEETVSGSFGMMKASLSDLAAGFGQEGSNMTDLIGNFQTSIEVFADNIKRVLGNMWDNLPLKPWQKYMGAILVATGPVLTGLGKVGSVIAGSFSGLGSIATNIGKFSGATKAAGGITQVFSGEMTQLGEAFPGFAKGIGALKKGFGALTSPAGLAIGAIVALGAGFVIAYKKSETFRNFIAKIGDMLSGAWQSIVDFKDQVVTAFDAVFSIFKGDKVGGAELLQSIGLSDETIQTIVVYVSVIRRKFFELKDRVTEALSIIGDFFKGIFESIGDWWNNNGETILGYVVTGFEWLKETIGLTMELIGAIWDRTWSIIQGVIEVVWPIVSGIISDGIQKIVDLFNFFAPIVSGIWNTLWPILQANVAIVWERIKLVIGTAMDIIQGVIKVATALINGDWSAAWNAVKETIANVKDRVVEYISNMKDIAVNLIKALVDNVVSWFTNLWTKITNRVNQIRDVASTVFANIKHLVVSRVKEMVNSVVRWFLGLFNNIRDRVNSIKTTVVRIFTDIKNNVLNRVKGLYNSVTDRFRDTYNSVKEWMTNAKNAAIDLAVGMKNRVIDKAKEILNYFKKLPRRLGDAIRNGKNAFKAGFAKMLNAGISSVESGVNKIIGGVNWVLDKLGASKISTWSASRVSVPAYAKGTDGHPEDGPAIVGDGGMKELIAYPDGSFGMSPNTPTLTNMPKGTQVLSGPNTKSLMNSMGIPQYKSGIGKAWDSVKNVTSSFWSWATDGAKNLLNKALGFLGVSAPSSSDGPGIFGNVAKGAFTTIKDAALDRIDKLIDDLFSAPSGGTGSGVNQWRGVATQALMMTGQFTPANLNSLLFQMSTESGGNPSAINNWDINAKRGTPSKGLMQVIDPTFQAYKMPGFNNIWNPLDNILASIRYALSRYGTLSRAYRGVGYADGGIVSKPGMYALAENGWPEFVIPTEPSKRGDAMKLLALAAKRLQKGNTQVNYSGGSSNGAALAPDMTETNNLLKTLIEMIAQGQVLKADDKALAEVVYGHIDETMNKNYSRKNIMRIKREE